MSETQPPLDPYRAWDIVARLRDEIETLRRERDALRALLREAGEALEQIVSKDQHLIPEGIDHDAYLALGPCGKIARAMLTKLKEALNVPTNP